MPSPLQKLLALVVVFGLGASSGCQASSNISTVEGQSGNRMMPSMGLGNLGGGNDKPDASTVVDPNGLKPFADAGLLPDMMVKEEKCAGESQMAKQVPIDLLLLVDRSGSMNTRVSPGGKTKWELAQDAVTTFVKDPKSVGIGVGLQYFPLVKACAADADCGLGGFGANACVEQRACAGATGPLTPIVTCSTRANSCPGGATCSPLGSCAQSGDYCTNIGQACAGGAVTNVCTVIPKACRDGLVTNCSVPDYQKLAVPIADLPAAAGPLSLSVLTTVAGGATPTDPAVEAAVAELRMRATSNPGRHEALILVTDGSPNGCDADPIPLITRMIGEAKAGMPSISTYTIGVLAPNEFTGGEATLGEWSTAGGTGTPFIVMANDDLTKKLLDALNAIRGSALPCEYTIPKPATGNLDYKKVNVHVTGSGTGAMGVDIGHVEDVSKCDPVKGGWYYDVDPATGTPSRVVMCEATCTKFKMDATANIELRFGCETIIIQ